GISGEDRSAMVPIQPFYSARHYKRAGEDSCYFTVQRRPRLYSNQQLQTGARAAYLGTECFMSIVDASTAATPGRFRRLDLQALCTNRDLPIQAGFGKARSDFLLESSAPVAAIGCLSGPTYPRTSPAFGDTAWKLINHLSLNYLSLRDCESGIQLLREMLALYAQREDAVLARQIEGVRGITCTPVVER